MIVSIGVHADTSWKSRLRGRDADGPRSNSPALGENAEALLMRSGIVEELCRIPTGPRPAGWFWWTGRCLGVRRQVQVLYARKHLSEFPAHPKSRDADDSSVLPRSGGRGCRASGVYRAEVPLSCRRTPRHCPDPRSCATQQERRWQERAKSMHRQAMRSLMTDDAVYFP